MVAAGFIRSSGWCYQPALSDDEQPILVWPFPFPFSGILLTNYHKHLGSRWGGPDGLVCFLVFVGTC